MVSGTEETNVRPRYTAIAINVMTAIDVVWYRRQSANQFDDAWTDWGLVICGILMCRFSQS